MAELVPELCANKEGERIEEEKEKNSHGRLTGCPTDFLFCKRCAFNMFFNGEEHLYLHGCCVPNLWLHDVQLRNVTKEKKNAKTSLNQILGV